MKTFPGTIIIQCVRYAFLAQISIIQLLVKNLMKILSVLSKDTHVQITNKKEKTKGAIKKFY